MKNEEIKDEEILKEEDKNEVLNNDEETRKNNELIEKLKSLVFEDRQVQFPNRKKIKVDESLSNDEFTVADIFNYEDVDINRKVINAQTMNTLVEAVTVALSKAVEANNTLVANKLSSIFLGDNFISTLQLDNIFSKLKNEVVKVLKFDSYGFLKIGKFVVDNSVISVDITSSNDKAQHAKLVISCKNHLITEAVVYDDDDNVIAPKLFIKPSSAEDSFIEIYFEPEYMSDNVIEIKGNMINEVLTNSSTIEGITDICNFVAQIPENATVTPANKLFTRFQNIFTLVENLTTNLNSTSAEINNLKNGNSVFTLLKANTIDLID